MVHFLLLFLVFFCYFFSLLLIISACFKLLFSDSINVKYFNALPVKFIIFTWASFVSQSRLVVLNHSHVVIAVFLFSSPSADVI